MGGTSSFNNHKSKAELYIRCRPPRSADRPPAVGFCAKAPFTFAKPAPRPRGNRRGRFVASRPSEIPGFCEGRDRRFSPLFLPPRDVEGDFALRATFTFAKACPKTTRGFLSSCECKVVLPRRAWRVYPAFFLPSRRDDRGGRHGECTSLPAQEGRELCPSLSRHCTHEHVQF